MPVQICSTYARLDSGSNSMRATRMCLVEPPVGIRVHTLQSKDSTIMHKDKHRTDVGNTRFEKWLKDVRNISYGGQRPFTKDVKVCMGGWQNNFRISGSQTYGASPMVLHAAPLWLGHLYTLEHRSEL